MAAVWLVQPNFEEPHWNARIRAPEVQFYLETAEDQHAGRDAGAPSGWRYELRQSGPGF